MNQNLLLSLSYQEKDIFANLVPIFKKLAKPGSVFFFQGHLGAGKTCIIKKVLKYGFGIDDVVSPTFGYVKVYTGLANQALYHYDLYRLKNPEDLLSLGFLQQELADSKFISFVEWPEIILEHFTDLVEAWSLYLDLYLIKVSMDFDKKKQFSETCLERSFQLFKLVN